MTATVVGLVAPLCAVAGVVLLVTSAQREVEAMRLVSAVRSLVLAGVATGLAVFAPLLLLGQPWAFVGAGVTLATAGGVLWFGVQRASRILASVDAVNDVFRDVDG